MSTDVRESSVLPDVQGEQDQRGIAIDRAGISDLRLPFLIEDVDGEQQSTVMSIRAAVAIGKSQRGTHMSRLVEEFENLDGRLAIQTLTILYRRICRRCDSNRGYLDLTFPWSIAKAAPISGVRSTLDTTAGYKVSEESRGGLRVTQSVKVPITTVCPCSKAISRYGAHNQRSIVNLELENEQQIAIVELVNLVESCASCEVYGILKRPDEKHVTETAYENPRFVEDVVRDVYAAVKRRSRNSRLRVSVESQESIHNHQAFAFVEDRR